MKSFHVFFKEFPKSLYLHRAQTVSELRLRLKLDVSEALLLSELLVCHLCNRVFNHVVCLSMVQEYVHLFLLFK